ncbi:MAG: exodeoxyribonuclease VII small subunit, partial [Clostridia bacterium]|nr:exodeoxyribonuclease VII small subunit [Clostridia bacterium]
MNEQEINSMTFEQAAAELEAIVGKLNSGSAQLDEMIALYERGVALS